MSLRADDEQALARVLAALRADAQLIHTPALRTLRDWAEAHGAHFASAQQQHHHDAAAGTSGTATSSGHDKAEARRRHDEDDEEQQHSDDASESASDSDSASSSSSSSDDDEDEEQHDDAASEPDEERWSMDDADAHDAALDVPNAPTDGNDDEQQQQHEPSDDDVEAAAALKAEAADAAAQGDVAGAIDKMTAALRRTPHNAMYWGLRCVYLLRARRPAAALRDAECALRINPQNVRALRVRGTVRRHLGDWPGALHDLSEAQTIDYDDTTAATMKFVQARVSARHARAVAQQEREQARAQRRRARELRRRQKAHERAQKHASSSSPFGAGGGAGGGGFGLPPHLQTLFSDPEMQAAMQDPDVASKLMQAMQNPASILTMMNDPKVGPLLTRLFSKMGAGGAGAPPPPSSSSHSAAGHAAGAAQPPPPPPPQHATRPAPPAKDELD